MVQHPSKIDASHLSMLSRPDQIATVIEEAALHTS
jgi:hypothetical protein